MRNYKKVVELVEAEQWVETVDQNERLLAEGIIMKSPARDGSCLVPTLAGVVSCLLNDWIVNKGIGDVCVISADEFELNYELVSDVSDNSLKVKKAVKGSKVFLEGIEGITVDNTD